MSEKNREKPPETGVCPICHSRNKYIGYRYLGTDLIFAHKTEDNSMLVCCSHQNIKRKPIEYKDFYTLFKNGEKK